MASGAFGVRFDYEIGDRHHLFALAERCGHIVINKRLYETEDKDFLKACTMTWNFHPNLNMSWYGATFTSFYIRVW